MAKTKGAAGRAGKNAPAIPGPAKAQERLRRGTLDGLVLDYMARHRDSGPFSRERLPRGWRNPLGRSPTASCGWRAMSACARSANARCATAPPSDGAWDSTDRGHRSARQPPSVEAPNRGCRQADGRVSGPLGSLQNYPACSASPP